MISEDIATGCKESAITYSISESSSSGPEAKVAPEKSSLKKKTSSSKLSRNQVAYCSRHILFDTASAAMCTNVRHIERLKICSCDSERATVFKDNLGTTLSQFSSMNGPHHPRSKTRKPTSDSFFTNKRLSQRPSTISAVTSQNRK